MPAHTKRIDRVKLLIYLLTAGCAVVLYSNFSSPLITPDAAGRLPFLSNLFGDLPGDLPEYSIRFFLSFFLLGIIPLCVTLVFRERVISLGFQRPQSFFRPRLFFFIAGAAVLGGYAGSLFPEFAAFYPYSSTLVDLSRDHGMSVFILHGAIYFLCYYLPWEFFFPFVKELFPRYELSDQVTPAMLAVASFQIIPSAMLHFGHPVSESLGAVLFGLCAGWFTLKTRSVWPALVFHAVMGISLDFFLFIKAG